MRVLFYKSLTYFNVKAPVDYRTTFRSEVEQFTDSISRSVVVIRALRILITFKGAAGADWNAFVFGLIQCNNQRWLLDDAWNCSIRQLSFLKPLHFCQRSFEERFQDNDRHDNKECGRRFHRCCCKFNVCYYNTTTQIPLRSAVYNLMAWFKICRFDSHLTKTKHYSLTWFSNYAIFQAICNCATAKSNTFLHNSVVGFYPHGFGSQFYSSVAFVLIFIIAILNSSHLNCPQRNENVRQQIGLQTVFDKVRKKINSVWSY